MVITPECLGLQGVVQIDDVLESQLLCADLITHRFSRKWLALANLIAVYCLVFWERDENGCHKCKHDDRLRKTIPIDPFAACNSR